ncbi:protein cueball [Ceratina calcarata]|uniref:Protein cueball n=1 Tax=Ceratina calcarata TaxID=156304 RepID=A0AAJ7NA99_9HYME|nr:protein cueball [Ceratina calcarata]
MTVRKNLVSTLTIIMGMLVINAQARSWDLAVVAGRKIEFLAVNGSLNGQAMLEEAGSLSGVAYDDVTRTIYFSDLNHENMSIYSSDLTDKNFTLTPLLKRQEESSILGLAFDTRTRTLFWSDTKQGSIMRMQVPVDEPPERPVILHDLKTRVPRGIALDVCNRHIYWVDSSTSSPSIERSNLDGSNRTTVISERLHEPIAVAVDHIEEKLYWIDDVEGIRIKIERSNLDGTKRELLAHPKRQRPSYMAVDRNSIYWSDTVHKVVWTLPKTMKPDDVVVEPSMFGSQDKYLDAIPAGILARDNVGKLDCAAMSKTKHKTSLTGLTYAQRGESYINLTTSTEESEPTTESSKYCLNDGRLDRGNSTCQCKLGYTGDYCETDLCHNYCFRGSCDINDDGLPTCKCNDTFVGPRCETDLCKDYCLHDGQCSVQNEKPVCKCKYFVGDRCEILNDTTEICKNYCENDETVPTSIAAICRYITFNKLSILF